MSQFGNRAVGAALAIACIVAPTLWPGPATPAEVAYDWSGFYFGGHMGYGRGTATSTVYDPSATASANSFGSMFIGLQGGYNVVLPSRMFVGVEADLSFANFYADSRIATRASGDGTVTDDIDYIGRVRGRLGYAFGRWMIYGTGGFAWSQSRVNEVPGVTRDEDKALRGHAGWVVTATGLNLIMGLYAPQGLPDEIKKILIDAVHQAAKEPAIVAKIEGIGLFSQYEDPATARQRLETEYRDIVELSKQLQQ